MPFGDAKIFQLIFSCGLRMAASSLGVQASRLFTELNVRAHDGKTSVELIDQELWFFAGVSLGGLLSVLLFLTCFQRKQYLLIVWLNSLYMLWNTSMYMFCYLDV